MKLVTVAQMRAIEEESAARGVPPDMLMANAGAAVAAEIEAMWGGLQNVRVLVLVGPGNNGGDGLVAARHLADQGAEMVVYLCGRTRDDENLHEVQTRPIKLLRSEEDPNFAFLREELVAADVVVDALLGIGLTRPLEGAIREALVAVREAHEARGADAFATVAVDVPSGLNADTGAIDPATPDCDSTIALGLPKIGLFCLPGAERVGEVVISDIGLPSGVGAGVSVEVMDDALVGDMLPKRPIGSHKGTFGSALVIGGSINYPGAPYLAASAAGRVGAGLVTLGVPRGIYSAVAARTTECTFLALPEDMGVLAENALKLVQEALPKYEALLVGPGLDRETPTRQLVFSLLGVGDANPRDSIGFHVIESPAQSSEHVKLPPTVIDADGLNALAEQPEWWTRLTGLNVLTPHPGEMSRLCKCDISAVQSDRLACAMSAAAKWQQVVVLKGAFTIVAAPDGRAWVNPVATPALATAGTGDVLSGAVAGLLAQGLDPVKAAVCGVFLHGRAGELAAEEIGDAGVVAGDLLPRLPAAIRSLK